ncbi:short-chain dehydrogenase helC [Aspergillus lucknowensis]|uniref:Uncharacterized protein n=1 Tax=Aspergillus lucknowensis TaxID=176173 RepID=A0ABR4LHT3_9EURO
MSVAIVTGAAQGVGFSIAQLLAQKGYKVVLSDIDTEKGEEAAAQINQEHGEQTAIFVRCDLARLADVDQLFSTTRERLGGFSILINNAGFLRAPFLALSAQDIENTIAINLTAPLYATQRAIQYWNDSPDPELRGQVVTVTSSSSFKTYASILPYGAAKAGAAQFTFAAHAFAPRVRVNAVAPTAIATGFDQKQMRVATDRTGPGYTPEEEMRAMGLHRLQPVDVARGVLRCIEDESLAGKVLYLDAREGTQIHSSF